MGVTLGRRTFSSWVALWLLLAVAQGVYGQATVTTQYNGLTFAIDGQYFNQTQRPDWTPGAQYTLDVISPQISCGGRYTFSGWSNGGPKRQTVTASASPATYIAQFTVEYELTVEATPSGAGSVVRSSSPPADFYPNGAMVTLTAVPAAGYVFVGWSGDYSGNSNPLSVSMNNFRNVTAVFAPAGAAAVTLVTNPPGLKLVVDGTAVTTPAAYNWSPGSEHTVSVPSPQMIDSALRYSFDNWADSGGSTRTVTTPLTPVVMTANFTAQLPLTLSGAPQNGGTIQATPVTADGWARQFEQVRLQAIPAAGYRFDRWSGSTTSRETTVVVTMESARSVTANFLPSGGCAPRFTRAATTAGANGDLLSASVDAGAQCAWTASSDAAWVTFTGAASGLGNATLRFTVQANPSASSRSANIQLTGGAVLHVTQMAAGCSFSISTQTVTLPAAGGSISIPVNGSPACQWIAAPSVDWITLSPGQGAGGGTLTLAAQTNSGAARTASISVGGQTIQVLQKTALPVTPAFQDVPASDLFFDYIQILNQNVSGAGCASGSYCPSAATTRAQMAEWIVRALHGDSFSFPSTSYFTDVAATHPQFRFIQKLREMGITSGCDTNRYCPNDGVTRGQMAAFLVRARLAVTSSQPFPSPAPQGFSDVSPANLFFTHIQKLRELGVTGGCTATTYCPDQITTRGQMAVFLVRAFFTP
ncbi:MAG: S-layer homology domain-containing protein [Bryobacterales bacterium]|nr:S-layer homology domain-containing protein [Bryobacterales bacterium]